MDLQEMDEPEIARGIDNLSFPPACLALIRLHTTLEYQEAPNRQ